MKSPAPRGLSLRCSTRNQPVRIAIRAAGAAAPRSTTEKIAVFAPIPSASASIAIAVTPRPLNQNADGVAEVHRIMTVRRRLAQFG